MTFSLRTAIFMIFWGHPIAVNAEAVGDGAAVEPALLESAADSLHLSLCAVVFEEDYKDLENAARYQAGSSHVQSMIRSSGWSSDKVAVAHDAVLERDFSFQLKPGQKWSEYRRSLFTKDTCDSVLSSIRAPLTE